MPVSSVCPKCACERPAGADACSRCGLLVSRWAGFKPDSGGHPLLDALWEKVLAAWDEDAPHARFLDQAAGLQALDQAAARYRSRLRDHGADVRAQAGLDRAVRLALQIQQVQQPDPGLGAAARWVKIAGIAIAVGLFVATMWVVLVVLGRR